MPIIPSRPGWKPLVGPGAAVLTALLCAPLAAQAQAQAQAQTPGELLYRTHCAECHSSRIHWRQNKAVRDWPSLRAQITFWQAQARLGWGEAEIASVAEYLNAAYYRLPPPPDARTTGAHTDASAGAALLAAVGWAPGD